VIDLHLHTNASDGRCSPRELVELAAASGLSVISVVDHDTFAAQAEVSDLAKTAGLRVVTGIEITGVWEGSDVHVLGYYLDPSNAALTGFLAHQLADRVRRVKAILERLRALGMPVAFEQVTARVGGRTPHAVGRPQVARALVRAGYVTDMREAFDRYLGEGRPGFVPRSGATPADVVRLIVASGGVASLAHPALLNRDDLIPVLVAAGMQAIEAYHPDHPADAVTRYRDVARCQGLAVTGGSDYHGEKTHGASGLGRTTLPVQDFERLEELTTRPSQG
jgi:3',5'-nucleoside bisphosphate phosphatase